MANLQSPALDTLGQSAIALGLAQLDDHAAEEIILELDELTQQRLKRLAASMSLSVKTIIESAINYTYSYITESKITADELPRAIPSKGSFQFKIILSLETTKKLELIGMSQSITECAIIGTNLLYDRLIPQDIPAVEVFTQS
jgi:hypothetical protein